MIDPRTAAPVAIEPAENPADMTIMRELFREYQAGVGSCECFVDFEAEIAGLPGRYTAPTGCLLIARADTDIAGGVALGSIDINDISAGVEMKRLYVRPAWRGTGLGRRMAERVIEEARSLGQSRLYLDTLPVMTEARALYASLGFAKCPPYSAEPTPGAICMELVLA